MSDLQSTADKKGEPRERFPNGDVDEKVWDRIYDDLLSKVTELIALSPTEITPEMDVNYDLGLDSLQMYELIISLEEMYDIRLSDEDLEKVHTVASFVDLVYASSK